MNEKTITVYAAGGMGVNVGHLIEDQARLATSKGDNTKFAKINVVYIDTSEANTKFRGINQNVYLYDGIDGSGSDRTRNKDSISDSIKDILVKFPPGDLSIVINSTAGGSGSVIGPMLVSQLLKEEKLVIAMATQTTSTLKQLKNTISVLATYETISVTRNRVLPLLLTSNNVENESNVNTTIVRAVELLAILFSGNVERLDSSDLDHWINYNKVTNNKVGAVLLDLIYKAESFPEESTICSVATLAGGPDSKTDFPHLVEYQAIGFINTTNGEEFPTTAIHFALLDGPIQKAYEARSKELELAERLTASRKTRKSIAADNSGDDGIVY